MLNCVIYLVTPTGYKYLERKLTKMKKQMEHLKVGLAVQKINHNIDEAINLFCYNSKKYDKLQLLVISDCWEAIRRLGQMGFPVIGFYHDDNKDELFEGVSYAVTDVDELNYKSYDEVYRRLVGIPWDILETKRLRVRESTVEDVEDFYRIYKEPSITRYVEDLFRDPDEERSYMQDYIRQMYGFYGFGMWTVIEKSEERIIGRAGLNTREGYELPELGFVIEKGYQKKGYAKEVCEAILRYAKDELLFDKVQALVEGLNQPSVRLLNKLGFVYEREVKEDGRIYRLMTKKLGGIESGF